MQEDIFFEEKNNAKEEELEDPREDLFEEVTADIDKKRAKNVRSIFRTSLPALSLFLLLIFLGGGGLYVLSYDTSPRLKTRSRISSFPIAHPEDVKPKQQESPNTENTLDIKSKQESKYPEKDNPKAVLISTKDTKTTNQQHSQNHTKIDREKTNTIVAPAKDSKEKVALIKQPTGNEKRDSKSDSADGEIVLKLTEKKDAVPEKIKQTTEETKMTSYTIPYLIPLIQGASYQKAALEYHRFLKRYPEAYSLRLEVVCQSKSVQTAYQEGKFNPMMFILPKRLGKKSCFAVFWGLYASQKEAEAALPTLPAFFTQQKFPPVSTLLRKYL